MNVFQSELKRYSKLINSSSTREECLSVYREAYRFLKTAPTLNFVNRLESIYSDKYLTLGQ